MKQIFKNKNGLLVVLIVGIIAMTVAFAAVSSQLNIFGTAKISSGSYKVVIDDWAQSTTPSLVSGVTNTGYQITAASVTSNTMTISGLKVGFKQPGDAVKYTFNIENQGTIDAAIDSFTLSTPTCTNASTSESTTCPGLTYEVKCGSPAAVPATGDNLLAGQTIPCYYYLAYNVVDASSLNQPAIEVGNINASWTYTQKATNSYTPSTTKYKLTLNSMGGSSVSNIEALGGSEITLPEPTKDGYEFDGWYTEEEGGTKITSNTMPTSNTIYYAHWKYPTYEITLDKQDGTGGTNTIYEIYNVKYSLTEDGNAMTTGANPITKPTRTGYDFKGYYIETNGGGTQYINENGYLTSSASNTNFSEDGTLYAYWVLAPICKRATSLHTEKCNSDSSSTSSYCRGDGYATNASIYYGRLGTAGNAPVAGDAFDCDVNGDGTYNSTNERFYYVSTYYDTANNSWDADTYVFIYYSNSYNGSPSTSNVAWYSSSDSTSSGPRTAKGELPSTSSWKNVSLKSTTRKILKGTGDTSLTYTAYENFSYEGKAARLLTMQEFKNACPNSSIYSGSMSSCNYFFERTKYSTSSYSTLGPWLESAYSNDSGWALSSSTRSEKYLITSNSSYYGARPVIEISKTKVSY